MCQERNVTQINEKEETAIVLYEEMKKAPNFKKERFRASKRQKQSWVPLHKRVFGRIFWTHGVFRLI